MKYLFRLILILFLAVVSIILFLLFLCLVTLVWLIGNILLMIWHLNINKCKSWSYVFKRVELFLYQNHEESAFDEFKKEDLIDIFTDMKQFVINGF